MKRPFVIGVGGFTSNVGKTTLMCELLRAFPGWEAIKTTRGHYRSCGKDPSACCVSHLLSEEPVIRSGRADTYVAGKDTGRYWDAGASNVHWLIATEDQIESGINQALQLVSAEGVLIEGNSFSQFLRPDYFVMVRLEGNTAIKKSAKAVLPNVSAFFISDQSSLVFSEEDAVPVFGFPALPALVSSLRNSLS
jgi:molybdopterin-guanine dinucleotide biosynthesis protein